MRHLPLALFLPLLACLGCGGGGGGGAAEDEEVLLGTWPYFEAGSSSERLDSLVLGFAAFRENGVREEEVVLADVRDGQIGLQARIEAPAGGTAARESDALSLAGGGGPDLAGSLVTAFQLDVTLVRIQDGIEDPFVKLGDEATAVAEGTTYEVRGTIRILGIPGPPEA